MSDDELPFNTENEIGLEFVSIPEWKFKLTRHYADGRKSHDIIPYYDSYEEAEKRALELDCDEFAHDIGPSHFK